MNNSNGNEVLEKRQRIIADMRVFLDWLEQNPSVELPHLVRPYVWFFNEKDKPSFLAIADAFGTYTKDMDEKLNKLTISKNFGSINFFVEIPRSVVCRKIMVTKEVEEWECDPLLPEIEAAIAGGLKR